MKDTCEHGHGPVCPGLFDVRHNRNHLWRDEPRRCTWLLFEHLLVFLADPGNGTENNRPATTEKFSTDTSGVTEPRHQLEPVHAGLGFDGEGAVVRSAAKATTVPAERGSRAERFVGQGGDDAICVENRAGVSGVGQLAVGDFDAQRRLRALAWRREPRVELRRQLEGQARVIAEKVDESLVKWSGHVRSSARDRDACILSN